MAVLTPAYRQTLQADPRQTVAVIVTTADDPATHTDHLAALGLTVTRTFRLTATLAATGPAEAVLRLASEDWVVRIEPDRPVHTA
ncbi:MAG: hypothetical protein D6796_06825 [Caldilineae bacterium]|nr:MAG: hypothetical protein D6796_06825 [Caldilineae bacterium]